MISFTSGPPWLFKMSSHCHVYTSSHLSTLSLCLYFNFIFFAPPLLMTDAFLCTIALQVRQLFQGRFLKMLRHWLHTYFHLCFTWNDAMKTHGLSILVGRSRQNVNCWFLFKQSCILMYVHITIHKFVITIIQICYIQIHYIQFCCKFRHVWIQICVRKTTTKKILKSEKRAPPLSPGMREYIKSVLNSTRDTQNTRKKVYHLY